MPNEIRLPGLRLQMQKPRVVAEGVGFCWYPDIMQFASGELMVTHSLNADSGAAQLVTAEAMLLSHDQGQSWDFAYDAVGASGKVRVSLPDGGIAGPGFYMQPDPPGQSRSFVLHYWRFDNSGRRLTIEPWGARVEGLPRDVPQSPLWSRWCHVGLALHSTAVEIAAGTYVTTGYCNYEGDARCTTEAFISSDYGRTWRYLATVASSDALPDAKEGLDECCMIQLADGDLMCVGRVGATQRLARTYSSDGGKSWSALDRLPIGSVSPSMVQLDNGVIALSAGRPGLTLAFSSDGRGRQWQTIDTRAFHNSVVEVPHQIRLGRPTPENSPAAVSLAAQFDPDDPFQTTGYTSLLALPGNRLLLVYDRIPYGWMPVPLDAEFRSRILRWYPEVQFPADQLQQRERQRIYLLEIEVQKE